MMEGGNGDGFVWLWNLSACSRTHCYESHRGTMENGPDPKEESLISCEVIPTHIRVGMSLDNLDACTSLSIILLFTYGLEGGRWNTGKGLKGYKHQGFPRQVSLFKSQRTSSKHRKL